ncbi:outer membrane beta-barrel protein [Gemmatimonas sp.]|uniref:outer membrane beta-barrel protein n=1 Tax=Gemmatimonas sp. TaxID=1962908 RepID=UPI0025C32D75|nr:outer membrane beta-barrel protein [Gemmatimonas sp.]MCA2992273.1 TonB-dependent receptor [Gemmatimonas sp.]
MTTGATAIPAIAQGAGTVTLSGRVQDAPSGQPIAYLTVQLRRQRDTAFVAGRLTDSTGAFVFTNLARGEYVLDLRRIGYAPLSRQVFVGELSRFLDVGMLKMEPAAPALDKVTVTATRDEVANAMDRKSYTLAENMAQSGGSVVQAMASLPGVTVTQDGKIQLRGSDKVAVLIDGKQSALTGVASQAGLENLPASAIERIEIITNPGAKFDANASAGIINLVLKQAKQEGFNGSVGFTGGAGSLWSRRDNLPDVRAQRLFTPKLNPNLALNYRRGGTNSFLRGDWLHSPTMNKNEFATRTYSDGTVITQQILRNRRTDYATLNGGVDHAFDAHNSLTVSALFNREKILDDGDNPYFAGGLGNRYRLWQFLEDEVKYTAFASTVFTHRFPQPGHVLTVTGNYSFHREDEQYFFTNTLSTFTGEDAFKLLSDEHIGDLNVDYVRPLPQGRLELGFKGRYRSIPVNMQFFPGPQSPIDSGAGGWATYREKIPAAYATYVFEAPTLEVEGGMRVEQVLLDYEVNPDHNTYRSDGYRYFQPFPTVRFAWKPANNHKLSLFFNRRVDRPNEVDIRIFPKYDEPELIKVGNPGLQPQFTTSVDLGYRAAWSSGSLYAAGYRRIVDATITRIATQAPGSPILYNVFQNAGRSWITGSELVWQQTVSRGVSLSTNANVYRTTIGAFSVLNRYPIPVTFTANRESLISGNFKVNANLLLPGRVDARVSSIYLAPDLFPQGRIGARYALDMGLRRNVQQGRGELVFNASDLLNTNQVRRTLTGADFRYVSTDYLETQVVRMGYTWKF